MARNDDQTPYDTISMRRRDFYSETQVKRGYRTIRGNKELIEKVGCNDPCPGDSGRRFQGVLP